MADKPQTPENYYGDEMEIPQLTYGPAVSQIKRYI